MLKKVIRFTCKANLKPVIGKKMGLSAIQLKSLFLSLFFWVVETRVITANTSSRSSNQINTSSRSSNQISTNSRSSNQISTNSRSSNQISTNSRSSNQISTNSRSSKGFNLHQRIN